MRPSSADCQIACSSLKAFIVLMETAEQSIHAAMQTWSSNSPLQILSLLPNTQRTKLELLHSAPTALTAQPSLYLQPRPKSLLSSPLQKESCDSQKAPGDCKPSEYLPHSDLCSRNERQSCPIAQIPAVHTQGSLPLAYLNPSGPVRGSAGQFLYLCHVL